ncbi:accessory factor UbiK family protein [Alphaproteobacteria bacterium]|jgi:BMFP domain-containing protein YqiC|nr:accessory factor UbiK family protein [Alphaproteobacteria bacterium]|tara:strand:- start:6964 stop:7224 length:261 start_codon:yes stop_codon:yes gene_type:complete
MRKTNFFLKDTASMVSGALSTFSSLKNEIDNIIKSRFEKLINSQGIVSREDFEALIDRHEKLNAEFNLYKAENQKKTLKVKDKNKK